MGGVPKTALNLVGYPDDKDPSMHWLEEIFKGGAERCEAAGVVIIGGDTVRDVGIKFGYAVTRTIYSQRIITKSRGPPAAKLGVTQGLGTGVVSPAPTAAA